MTSPDPTPAEIEAAAREWCVALGYDPDGACFTVWGEPSNEYWQAFCPEARALIALRAKDKARIAELEAQLESIREAAQHACDVREGSEVFHARITLRAALAAVPEKRDV